MTAKSFKSQFTPEKLFFISTSFVILLILGFTFFLLSRKPPVETPVYTSVINSTSQEVNVTAKEGFTPSYVSAKADLPINLNVSTKDTFDCSSMINIPSLGISQQLPSTGVASIKIPAQSKGTRLNATCSLGKYNLVIDIS